MATLPTLWRREDSSRRRRLARRVWALGAKALTVAERLLDALEPGDPDPGGDGGQNGRGTLAHHPAFDVSDQPPPVVVTAPPAPPPPEPPAPWRFAQHVTRRIETGTRALRDNWDFRASDDVVESLHDLRVASRRLRAFLDTFSGRLPDDVMASAKRPLRRVTRAIGMLREWDVHGVLVRGQLDAATDPVERAALEYVLERIDRRRRDERRQAAQRLRKIDVDEIEAALRDAGTHVIRDAMELDGSLGELAWGLVEPSAQRAFGHYPKLDGVERPTELHEFRIGCKRLRYALELVEPLLGTDYGGLRKAVRRVQTLLGDHHDRVLLQEILDRRRKSLRKRQRFTLADGLDRVLARVATERQALFHTFAREAASFDPQALQTRILTALGVPESAQTPDPESDNPNRPEPDTP